MATQTLLVWLVLYASLFAASGFVLMVARGFTQRRWSNRAVLRASSGFAFVAAAAIWLLVILSG
jgi:hypothetical protein